MDGDGPAAFALTASLQALAETAASEGGGAGGKGEGGGGGGGGAVLRTRSVYTAL